MFSCFVFFIQMQTKLLYVPAEFNKIRGGYIALYIFYFYIFDIVPHAKCDLNLSLTFFFVLTNAEIDIQERTMLMDRFDEVTVGVDPLYFISSARPEHSGTYQCEIFSQEHSLVRIYYYLTGDHAHMKKNNIPELLLLLISLSLYQMYVVSTSVVPLAQLGHVELQDVFEQALLPGGQFPPLSPKDPFTLWVPSPVLLTTCLTAILLLVFLMLG